MQHHQSPLRHEIEQVRRHIHQHPEGTNRSAAEIAQDTATRGEQLADRITSIVGSWRFITIQALFLVVWLILNAIGWLLQWDPYPFILLNLVLSFQAAFTAPIIMMSQNRQTARDRVASELDFAVNRAAAAEVDEIQAKLDELQNRQWGSLLESLEEHRAILNELHKRTAEIESLIRTLPNLDSPV